LVPWKARIVLILEEGELWDIVENPVVPPTDVVLMAEFRKRNIRAKRTILDAVKDHVIPHVSGKDFTFQMWQSLCGLYQSPNQNRKMVLQEKLRGTKMTKTDTVTSFLTRFSQIRDELASSWRDSRSLRVGEDNLKWLFQTLGEFCTRHRG
jgi:hypothetical protein